MMNIRQIPLAALIIANLFFLIMAAIQQWGYAYILICIWLETLIIGFYNVGCIFVVCLLGNPLGKRIGLLDDGTRIIFSLFLNAVFIFKFGAFALGMGLLILATPAVITGENGSAGLFAAADAFQVIGDRVLPVAAALFLSHGISFFMNFIKRREYRHRGVIMLLFWPYARLVLILTVMFFGFQTVSMVPSLARLPLFTVMVMALKLMVDIISHKFEHRQKKDTLQISDHPKKQ